MNLQDIICDFEYAEKLKELGVLGVSIYQYSPSGHLSIGVNSGVEVNTYTVAELGEMLPARLFIDDKELISKVTRNGCNGAFSFCYQECINENIPYFHSLSTSGNQDFKEANSRAKMLIWLIENNHVNVEELNKC